MEQNIRGVVSSVQKLHSTTTNTREKNKYLSLVALHFPGVFLKSVGFKFLSSSLARVKRQKILNQNLHFVHPSKTQIYIAQKRKINDFLLQNSTVASNKTKKIKFSNYLL